MKNEKCEWTGFRRALRRDEAEAFDRIMEACETHSLAGSMIKHRGSLEVMIMTMLLHLEIKADKLGEKMEKLEEYSRSIENHDPSEKRIDLAEKPRTSEKQFEMMTHNSKLEDVKISLDAYSAILDFKESNNHIIIKPKRFLSKMNFVLVAQIIRNLKGSYVSAAKNSHFKIPK
jgi:hypothetical protein